MRTLEPEGLETTAEMRDVWKAAGYFKATPVDTEYMWRRIEMLCRDVDHLTAEVTRLQGELVKAHSLAGDLFKASHADAVKVATLEANATAREEERERIKQGIDIRLNNSLCEMKPNYDDSITGFNEAWDIVRKYFAARSQP